MRKALSPGWAAAALCGTCLGAHFALAGIPPWPPRESWQWLPALAIAGTFLGLLDRALAAGIRWVLRTVLACAAGWVLSPEGSLRAAWAAGTGAAILASCLNLDPLASGFRGRALPLGLAGWAALGALSLGLSGCALFGLLCGGMAAGLALCAAFALPLEAVVLPLSVVSAGLWLNGWKFSETPGSCALLLWASPWTLQAIRIGPAGTLAVALPAGAAALLAWRASPT